MPRKCTGSANARCRFARNGTGDAACAPAAGKCVFCSRVAMEHALGSAKGKATVTRLLKGFKAANDEVYQLALKDSVLKDFDATARAELVATCNREVHLRRPAAAQAGVLRRPACVRARAGQEKEQWVGLLKTHRKRLRAEPTLEELREYQTKLNDERGRILRKFFPLRRRRVAHSPTYQWANPITDDLQAKVDDVLPNDSGLPVAHLSREAMMLEKWCKFGSWVMCATCHTMHLRHLREPDLTRVAPPTRPSCKYCHEGATVIVPQYADVPEALRDLPQVVIHALRPLTVDFGPQEIADYGYRFHTAMVRFAWEKQDVKEKIRELPDDDVRRVARKAFKYLMAAEDSRYGHFVQEHRTYSERFPEAGELQRKRPLRFIEEEGVECAIWPHLYHKTSLCETVVRSQDVRRVRRRNAAAAASDDSGSGHDSDVGSSDSADDDGDGAGQRTSVKRSFLAKVFSPVMEYSASYELLHFVFDLALWSDVGAKRNMRGAPLRILMKGAPWTAAYWRLRHAAAIDLQAQCGYPVAFKTWAPYEWSAPYHAWVLHEMDSLLRHRLELAGPETLHLAHIMVEMFREWVAGGPSKHGCASKRWRQAVFSTHTGNAAEGERIKVNFLARLEYQDGHRKLASQDYHGRGTVHLHGCSGQRLHTPDFRTSEAKPHRTAGATSARSALCAPVAFRFRCQRRPESIKVFCWPPRGRLIFAESIAHMKLEERLQATVPPEGHPLRGYVLDGQTSRSGSGWEVHEEPSRFDQEADRVHLHHTEEDETLGVRAFDLAELEVFKFHVDTLIERGTGLMLKYVATYSSKFSDSAANELLDDAGTDYNVARRVLSSYRPGEAEMWLTLAQQQLPPFAMGGTMHPIIAPWPGMEPKPNFVKLYETSTWRGEEMGLLEFLRKTNAKGEILQHIRKAHAAAAGAVAGAVKSLEGFARDFQTFGEKVVAAETVSMLNDKFYGQWMALHLQYRDLDDLVPSEVFERVPQAYRFLAAARLRAPHVWREPEAIRSFMELRAHAKAHVANVVHMVMATGELIDQYLAGHRPSDRLRAALGAGASSGDGVDAPRAEAAEFANLVFTPEQQRLEYAINLRVDQALAVLDAANDQEADAARARAAEHATMVAGFGPAGCGKTAVVDRCVQRAVEKGARVLYALPTGQLASRMRVRHGDDLDVDTCHGAMAFHRPLPETLSLLLDYDLVVIDEAPQLLAWHFDRIHELWLAAGQLPCVVMTGDEWQLPPPDSTQRSITANPKFRTYVKRFNLHKIWRQDDNDPLAKKLVALRKFDVTAQDAEDFVKNVCKNHKAWSGHHEPTVQDLDELFRRTENKTTLVTCTRRGATILNELSVQVLFHNRNKRALATLPADYEDNAENYKSDGTLRLDRPPTPSAITVYPGMRVTLSKNVNKANHFVNGMTATVQAYSEASKALIVRTVTGHTLSIFPWTDAEVPVGRVTFYPVRIGYAATIYKFQGAELQHITIWLDRMSCPAAAYVALSRVKKDRDYLFGGVVTAAHFRPAK